MNDTPYILCSRCKAVLVLRCLRCKSTMRVERVRGGVDVICVDSICCGAIEPKNRHEHRCRHTRETGAVYKGRNENAGRDYSAAFGRKRETQA
jgi:hypothetical protein